MKHPIVKLAMAAALLLVAIAAAQAEEKRVTQVAKGEFTVSIKPLSLEDTGEKDPRGRMSIDKQVTGDLVGTTRGQMLTGMSGTVQSSGAYVAIEEVTGTLQGKKGSFLLHHLGVMDNGKQDLSVVVVPDSGTGELTGIAGNFRIIIEGGKHFYEFTYSLPAVPASSG